MKPFEITLVLKGTRSDIGGFGWRYYYGPTVSVKGIHLKISYYFLPLLLIDFKQPVPTGNLLNDEKDGNTETKTRKIKRPINDDDGDIDLQESSTTSQGRISSQPSIASPLKSSSILSKSVTPVNNAKIIIKSEKVTSTSKSSNQEIIDLSLDD